MSKSFGWLKPAGALVAAGALMVGMNGCNGCNSNTQAPITDNANGPDPADANMASTDGSQPTQVMGQTQSYTPQQSSETYSSGQQAPAPIVRGSDYNGSQDYSTQQNGYYDNGQQAYDQGYDNGAADAYAEADQPPPPLPAYDQPPAPDDNDIWTPGYWGYADTGYYWTPGAWVLAPYAGALWTPGWWGFYGGHYRWHRGYWGRHIGYYGGIDYGHGYIGTGYYGGYWNNNHFYYNSAVNHVSPRITNIYERNVVVNNMHYTNITNNRVSYNGGHGGVEAQPRPYEVAAMHEQHMYALPAQQQVHREAAMNRANFYADNHGRPPQAAIAQPVMTHPVAPPPEVNRGGFGRPGAPGNAPNAAAQQQAQRNEMEQQRNQQLQQRNQNEQQRNLAEQQRVQNEQQHNAQLQQHNQAEQQRNVAEQQRNQNEQQRNAQLQQHNQMQQQQNAAQQQRNQQLQQRNAAEQQHNAMEQQRNQQLQRNDAAQREAMMQRQQQIHQQAPQHQIHPVPMQQHVEQAHPQAAPQQHIEQHAAPMQAPHAAPAPHMEAPHAAPAAAPHAAAPPAGGGEHPGGGGHH